MKLFWGNTDYNLILEKILDSKYFSSNSKSLLLSMIYKIENCYDDYKIVKVCEKTKEEILSEIIEDIKKYCDNIKLIEPDSQDAKVLKENNLLALTNEKERSILAYPTEISLLYAVSDVIPKYFYIPDSFIYKNAMQSLLVNGYNESNVEILSDFNGWSWDVNLKYKSHVEDNLIYQNLEIIFGKTYMDEWMSGANSKNDFMHEIKKYFSATKYYDVLCKFLRTELGVKEEAKANKKLEKVIKELELISDKMVYFENVKKSKMKYLKEVEKIDLVLNNKEFLKKEYEAKNQKLDPDKKIATLGIYKKMLEERREKCLEQISELSKALNPINYINHKRALEQFIKTNTPSNEEKFDILIELQVEFLKALKDEIFETEEIETLIDFIYKIRYYRYIYISKDKQIKDILSLEKIICQIQNELIKRICEGEGFRIISKNIEFNSEIIRNILDTKIIELSEIKFEVDIKNETLICKTYENETYEKSFELPCKIPRKDLDVKQGKILKLFK